MREWDDIPLADNTEQMLWDIRELMSILVAAAVPPESPAERKLAEFLKRRKRDA